MKGVYNYVVLGSIDAKLGRFYLPAIRTFANLVATTGCHENTITMTTVSNDLFLYI